MALDDARVNRPTAFTLPDQIWIARWDGDGEHLDDVHPRRRLEPARRVKQYQGGHDETWGGVKINIDRNFLDVGQGSVAAPELHCGGVKIAFGIYDRLKPATTEVTPSPAKVQALQCLLQEQGVYAGTITGSYDAATIKATNTWQTQHGFKVKPVWTHQELDVAAHRRREAGDQVRLRRSRRTTRAAGAQRGDPHHDAVAGDRRLRRSDHDRAQGVAEAGRGRGVGRRRLGDLGRAERRTALRGTQPSRSRSRAVSSARERMSSFV